jgi:hypothetical protein
MKSADKIKDLVKNLRYKPSTEAHNRMLSNILNALDETKSTHSAQPNIWRIIMTNRKIQLTTAVTVILIISLFLYFSDTSIVTKAYAITDMPELLYSADNIHMKGTSYFKPPEGSGGRPVAVPTEYWLDLANGRWKMTWPGYGGGPGVFEVSIEEKSCDGGDREIVMNHNAKTFYYNRISEFQRKLFCLRHTKQLVNRAIGNPELYDSYRNVGQEEINGQMYDIWEVVEQQQGYIPGLKMRSWLSPQTGEFAKVITWIQNRDGTWQKRSEIESVERNIEMGDEIFPTRPPRGYKLQNPRFRPKSSGLAQGGGSVLSINYSTQIILAMPDGSIIVCWSCEDKDSRQSQAGNHIRGLSSGLYTEKGQILRMGHLCPRSGH